MLPQCLSFSWSHQATRSGSQSRAVPGAAAKALGQSCASCLGTERRWMEMTDGGLQCGRREEAVISSHSKGNNPRGNEPLPSGPHVGVRKDVGAWFAWRQGPCLIAAPWVSGMAWQPPGPLSRHAAMADQRPQRPRGQSCAGPTCSGVLGCVSVGRRSNIPG